MTETPNVAVAIAGAAAEISAVPKDKTSQGAGSFSFRSIDGVMNALHGPLSKHGVSIIPEVVDYVCEGASGSRRLHTIKVRYRIYGPAGDHVDAVVIGQGIDSQDKGYGMAMSYAFKTMASQVFTLPTDDPARSSTTSTGMSSTFGGPSRGTQSRCPPPRCGLSPNSICMPGRLSSGETKPDSRTGSASTRNGATRKLADGGSGL